MHSSTSVSGTFAKSSRESVTWQQGCIQRWDTNTLSTVARSQQILDQNKDRHRHKFSTICEQNAVLGIRSSNFGSLVFCQKSERMSNLLKKWAIRSFSVSNLSNLLTTAHSFWPEQIAHGRSFVLSDLTDSLTSLRRNERTFVFFITSKNWSESPIFCERIRKWAICSKKNERFAHLSWATWVNCSHLLICHEQPERFAHSRSFILNNLSESLTFAHLS